MTELKVAECPAEFSWMVANGNCDDETNNPRFVATFDVEHFGFFMKHLIFGTVVTMMEKTVATETPIL